MYYQKHAEDETRELQLEGLINLNLDDFPGVQV